MIEFLETSILINIEVPNRYPLQCPQCYCKLNIGKDIDKNAAINTIKQVATLHVKYINANGGETLLYPYLLELISTCSDNKILPNIAISGWHFNEVMPLKPDSNGMMLNFLTKEQIEKTPVFIKKYSGNVQIIIDKCFSQLKAYMGRNIFSNINQGLYKGCTAELDLFTLNVDGKFTLCRHLFIPESYSNITDYWANSLI